MSQEFADEKAAVIFPEQIPRRFAPRDDRRRGYSELRNPRALKSEIRNPTSEPPFSQRREGSNIRA